MSRRMSNRFKLERAIELLDVSPAPMPPNVETALRLLYDIRNDNHPLAQPISDGSKITEDEKKDLVSIVAHVVGHTDKCYFIRPPMGHKSVPLARSKVAKIERNADSELTTFVIPSWLNEKINEDLSN